MNDKQTQVQFSMTDVELVAQLIQGTFPNYNQLIPGEYNTSTVVDVDDFMRSARVAAIFARDGSGIVRLQVQPDRRRRLREAGDQRAGGRGGGQRGRD